MPIADYVEEIKRATVRARSEAKLEGELNHILARCLAEFGIEFDPHVNETLRSMGLAQVDSDRPDGVFGHIVYDYKAPRAFLVAREVTKAKSQIEKYLDAITGGHSAAPSECAGWFGYICDGAALFYCRSNRREWQWSGPLAISESSLLFLVHAFRSLRRKPLTAQLLSQSFGKEADVARELIRVMCSHLAKPRHKTNMLFREWKRLFEQVSTYGLEQLPSLKRWASDNGIATQDASHILFAMHSYYSLVVKLLTSELLSISAQSSLSVCDLLLAASRLEDLYSILGRIESGEYYRRYRISNFLEGDFFSWYTNERSRDLADAIRALAREFSGFEPASALLLAEAKQDLLKEFYSSLVDEQIRHDLGEYYTPDWLAQHLLDKAGYHGQLGARLLDPACGSGTFLVESIARLRERCVAARKSPLQTLQTVLNNVKGIDLNPLAVISARANYILAIWDLVFDLGHDIELPVYLADAVNVPVFKTDAEGNRYLEYLLDTEVQRYTLEIPLELVEAQVLGLVLLEFEESVGGGRDFASVLRTLQRDTRVQPTLGASAVLRLEKLYLIMAALEAREWDRIWCRIIKNSFSPRGFAQFHFIVGNPPWVRWSRLPEVYRDRVKAFCDYYGLVSGRGYSGGIESDISTVITFSSADNWLADEGTIAFLITWTVFKSDSARGFRLSSLPNGRALRMVRIEDLTAIQPFPDATNETSLYIARKVAREHAERFTEVPCGVWTPKPGRARIPSTARLQQVYDWCEVKEGAACPVGEWGSPLFTGDIDHYRASSFLRGSSTYLDSAHRGTISDCARVFWVKVLKYSPETGRALIRTLTEEELPRAKAVRPVEGAWIEAELLWPLVRGRDVGRYCHKTEGWYQLVPNVHYEQVLPEDEFADRYPLGYSYLKNYEELLRGRATYRRYQSHLPFYVIYCVGDYSFSPNKVVWMEQQDPSAFRAAVISSRVSREQLHAVAVPDHKLYFAPTASEEEAHYLCGFLNSAPVRTWLGGFLLGKQIGTSIFEYMKLPRYDSKNAHCVAIADISQHTHKTRDGRAETGLLDDAIEELLSRHVKALCNTGSRGDSCPDTPRRRASRRVEP